MWEYEIKHKRNMKVRKIFGETVGNAFRRFGLEQDSWILLRKREVGVVPEDIDDDRGEWKRMR
ncbi:MAG: hypothetical protein HFF90_13650 [Oscillibacter sp.]|nr:hypothetical protein [Oscillibacter sp.]